VAVGHPPPRTATPRLNHFRTAYRQRLPKLPWWFPHRPLLDVRPRRELRMLRRELPKTAAPRNGCSVPRIPESLPFRWV